MDLVKKGSPFYNCNWPSWISAATKDPAAAAFLRAYHSRPAEELYRIDEDPFEKTNFADDPKHQAVLKELRGLVTERMKKVGDDQSLSGEPRLLKDHPLPTVPDGRNSRNRPAKTDDL
jgi:N-sulfoglucosamine sulfohydrolase